MKIALSVRFILIMALVLPIAGTAIAQNSPNYMNLKLGGLFPADDLDDADFDDAFMGEVAYGRYVCPYGAFELGIGYYETEMTAEEPGYPAIGFAKEENDLSVVPVTITVKGIYPFEKGEIFVGIGGGFYLVDLDGDITVSGVGATGIDDDDTVLGGHLLLGINYNVTEKFFLGAEAKGIWTEEAEFEDDYMGLPVKAETDLNGYALSAVVGFRF